METTYNPLPIHAQQFFDRLRRYLETPVYFFGSIQRPDYCGGGSDLDVDIFTDNPRSTVLKLQAFLPGVVADDFKHMVWKVNETGKVARGTKIMYKNDPKLVVEFSIYDAKYRDDVLREHRRKMVLPWFITVLLIILKTFYYRLGLIPDEMYTHMKRFVLNTMVNAEEEHFIITTLKRPR